MFVSRKLILLTIVLLPLLLVASCKKKQAADSEVVAQVGSREITVQQVDALIKEQLDSSGGGTLSSAELVMARLSVLDNLIQEEALYQRAQKENLVPDDNKVNQEIQTRKQAGAVTEEQYQNQLKQAGLTEQDYRERVRRELAIAELRKQENAKVSPPTEDEIRKYYEDHKDAFRAERGVDISVIAVSPNNNGGPAGAEQKIKSLYDRLEQHTDFATLASQQSEEQRSAMNGGRLGFASEAMIKQSFPTVPNLAETLMAMSAGQHTKPLKDEATGAWYIFQVNDKLEQSRNLTFEDARQTIVNTLTQQRQQVLWNAVLMLALSEANVKNYLAERIVQNPKVIVDMRPSQLLESGGQPAPAQQQPQPRFEDEAQSTNSSRAASANANKPAANANRRPATPNAN